jgi:predicted nucleic acid-binding protein
VADRISKLLVVDASVVHAAGANEHVHSSATRKCLNWILEICHRVVMTEDIREEWHRHQSKFSRRWRVAMYARKKIVELQLVIDEEFRDRMSGPGRTADQRAAILKDLHLIEAALQADRIVVSLDETARMLFQVQELSTIIWVNPISEHHRIQSWLEQGAPPVDEWMLG